MIPTRSPAYRLLPASAIPRKGKKIKFFKLSFCRAVSACLIKGRFDESQPSLHTPLLADDPLTRERGGRRSCLAHPHDRSDCLGDFIGLNKYYYQPNVCALLALQMQNIPCSSKLCAPGAVTQCPVYLEDVIIIRFSFFLFAARGVIVLWEG